MMQSDQVTDGMYEAAVDAKWSDRESCNEALAAALTAVPDDLLRQLCAERGCVMVPPQRMKDLICDYWEIAYREGCERRTHDTPGGNAQRVWGEICKLLNSDPRQQAKDDGGKA